MSDTTPTPITLGDGQMLTTRGEARRIGHGQWIPAELAFTGGTWNDAADTGANYPDEAVIWRPTPPRMVTIELAEDDARWWAERGTQGYASGFIRIVEACRKALADLEDDQ